MIDYSNADVFSDEAIAQDPHAYFEFLRAQGPVALQATHGVFGVTGYEEGLAVFRDDEKVSAIDTTSGPFLPLTYDPSRDIDEQIAEARRSNPFLNNIMTQDLPDHARSKSILNGIITPSRLKKNEAFMHKLSDSLIDEIINKGKCEVIADYGAPFAQLVIADLLGVPEEDHAKFRDRTMQLSQLPGTLKGEFDMSNNPLLAIAADFAGYIADRRANPRSDSLTHLAQQRYEDGTLPEVMEVVSVATFLFGAGQDTTVQLFAAMLRFLSDTPGLQEHLRANRNRIPDFVEEILRLEGTVKSSFRYLKQPLSIDGKDLKPGTHLMMHIAAMNRDPRKYENPHSLNIDRSNLRTHMAFGRGLHACAGAPLARSEAIVTLERLFDRTKDIRIDESQHGPADARRYEYLANYALRGVVATHIEFDAA